MFPLGKPVSVVLVSKDPGRGLTFSMSRVADVEERQNFRDFNRAQRATRDEAAPLGSFGALLRERLDLPEPAPVAAETKAAAGAAPVGTARVLSDSPQPDAARTNPKSIAQAAQAKEAQDAKEQNAGVVHGRRRPNKPNPS
jgi:hypothetical protein